MSTGVPRRVARELLLACPVFTGLSPELMEQIHTHMSELSFTAGDRLIRQGDPGEFLLVLLLGKAHALAHDEHTVESHVVGHLGPGDVAGEMALVTREPRNADVIADSPGLALRLPADAFHDLVALNPELGAVLTSVIADRLGRAARDGLGGKLVAGYRIEECVGRGAMAMVYRARQEATGNTVALKMMSHRFLYNPEMRSLFRQEAEVLAGLQHEQIACVSDNFPAYSTHFLAIDYCDGPALGTLVNGSGGLSEETARRILGQLAKALAYLHERGVVHADLKPDNVMLTSDGGVKLTDFGLARPTVGGEHLAATAGLIVGTPIYMSPEMLDGEPPDARSDLYALACIAYETVAGHRLFQGQTYSQIVRQKLGAELPAAAEIGAGISDELHTVIAGGLRRSPDERELDLGALASWAGPVHL